MQPYTQYIHTHEASGIALVCAHFAIDLNESLVDNLLHFCVGEGVLQAVTEKHHHG